MNKITIDTAKLAKYCLGVRMRVIKRALQAMNTSQEKKLVEYVLSFLGKDKTGKRIDLREVIVRRDYDKVIIERMVKDVTHTPSEWMLSLGGKLGLSDCVIETKVISREDIQSVNDKVGSKNTVYFDIDKLLLPLKIRYRMAGDIFIPFGFRGRKKLKDVLIDDKIPVYKRESIPLVVDCSDNILWIVGHRRSNIAPIIENTQQILAIKFLS